MDKDPGLKNMAFPFVRVAPRPGKPRETGLTIVADRGIAMNRVTDLIDASGPYIDFVKVAIGAFPQAQDRGIAKGKHPRVLRG
jgi:phosphosulfolactate synthase (CoM biosynthesis protein A)